MLGGGLREAERDFAALNRHPQSYDHLFACHVFSVDDQGCEVQVLQRASLELFEGLGTALNKSLAYGRLAEPEASGKAGSDSLVVTLREPQENRLLHFLAHRGKLFHLRVALRGEGLVGLSVDHAGHGDRDLLFSDPDASRVGSPTAEAGVVVAVALAGFLFDLLLEELTHENSGQLQVVLQQGQLHLPGFFLQLLKAGGGQQFPVGRACSGLLRGLLVGCRGLLVRWIFSVGIGRLRSHKGFLPSVCDWLSCAEEGTSYLWKFQLTKGNHLTRPAGHDVCALI